MSSISSLVSFEVQFLWIKSHILRAISENESETTKVSACGLNKAYSDVICRFVFQNALKSRKHLPLRTKKFFFSKCVSFHALLPGG